MRKVITASRVPQGTKFTLYWDCPNKKCNAIHTVTQNMLNISGVNFVCNECKVSYLGTVVLMEGRHSVKFTVEVNQ